MGLRLVVLRTWKSGCKAVVRELGSGLLVVAEAAAGDDVWLTCNVGGAAWKRMVGSRGATGCLVRLEVPRWAQLETVLRLCGWDHVEWPGATGCRVGW